MNGTKQTTSAAEWIGIANRIYAQMQEQYNAAKASGDTVRLERATIGMLRFLGHTGAADAIESSSTQAGNTI